MADNNFKDIDQKIEEKDEKKKPHPPHDLPPHVFKELMDLKEKVGKLEGQMDVLLRLRENKA
ncbi:MAG TPA: hypothetical protein VMR19_01660 [Candidatus Saccharimonadales bacterium]|jgi:hypothetical protein|nr:hypothetical protein [Candidatus Saccharimonadales bacterium]